MPCVASCLWQICSVLYCNFDTIPLSPAHHLPLHNAQMTIETRFDVPLVAAQSLREKQIQQRYRPVIAVHKWFARRPGSLFRALALSEFGDAPLGDLYFKANQFPERRIADPFMGGGTPLLEANRLGCAVIGFDINPMSAWIVREEMERLDVDCYRKEADRLLEHLRYQVGHLYATDCPRYGDRDAPVKYFLWVKVLACADCHKDIDLFPGYRVALDVRHTHIVLVCPDCGELNEAADRASLGFCGNCQCALKTTGPAIRGRCVCPHCGHRNSYPRPHESPLRHRLFAIEYFNPVRKSKHKGRFFKKPDEQDLQRVAEAESRRRELATKYVPDATIPAGDETNRLHRWGYRCYRDMFNARQLLGLELSCRLIAQVPDQRIQHALGTNLSDLLRYQNILCRYDIRTLKSLDIFSVHGFPVGQVQCESNLLGILDGRGISVGSGGWTNIIDKYTKAKLYCMAPFEVKRQGNRNMTVPIEGEWIGERLDGLPTRDIALHCADSTAVALAPQSLDAVFTDPPYFSNVQYGELMDFCYVWLRRLMGEETEGFELTSTRTRGELSGNVTRAQGLTQFTTGLAQVYRRMAEGLQPGAPLAFTYHHNRLEAYQAVGVAILDAGLACSASIPCPTEMKGSIHIHGTVSSIVDTIFVCRKTGKTRRSWLFSTVEQLTEIVAHDQAQLEAGGCKPTVGDTRCILYGHLTRMAIWNLRERWDPYLATEAKLHSLAAALQSLPDPAACLERLNTDFPGSSSSALKSSDVPFERKMTDAVAF